MKARVVALEESRSTSPVGLTSAESSSLESLKEKIEDLEDKASFPEIEELFMASPRAGRLAAKVIVKDPSFEEAETVHDVFMATPIRTYASWAHYFFLYRMEMEGHGNEIMMVAYDIMQQTGDDIVLDDEDDDVKKLKALYDEKRIAQ